MPAPENPHSSARVSTCRVVGRLRRVGGRVSGAAVPSTRKRLGSSTRTSPTGGVRHLRRPAPLHPTGTALATMGVAAEGDAALGVSGAALASAGCLLGDDCAMAEYELIDSVK